MAKGWIGVDLDGTLAEYDHWRGIDHVGAPIPAMVGRVRQWLDEGKDVRIFTARASTNENYAPAINVFCMMQFGRTLPITCVKDLGLIEFWDDRAVQVEYNTGRRVGNG